MTTRQSSATKKLGYICKAQKDVMTLFTEFCAWWFPVFLEYFGCFTVFKSHYNSQYSVSSKYQQAV